jgi:hypothetical protein
VYNRVKDGQGRGHSPFPIICNIPVNNRVKDGQGRGHSPFPIICNIPAYNRVLKWTISYNLQHTYLFITGLKMDQEGGILYFQ